MPACWRSPPSVRSRAAFSSNFASTCTAFAAGREIVSVRVSVSSSLLPPASALAPSHSIVAVSVAESFPPSIFSSFFTVIAAPLVMCQRSKLPRSDAILFHPM